MSSIVKHDYTNKILDHTWNAWDCFVGHVFPLAVLQNCDIKRTCCSCKTCSRSEVLSPQSGQPFQKVYNNCNCGEQTWMGTRVCLAKARRNNPSGVELLQKTDISSPSPSSAAIFMPISCAGVKPGKIAFCPTVTNVNIRRPLNCTRTRVKDLLSWCPNVGFLCALNSCIHFVRKIKDKNNHEMCEWGHVSLSTTPGMCIDFFCHV